MYNKKRNQHSYSISTFYNTLAPLNAPLWNPLRFSYSYFQKRLWCVLFIFYFFFCSHQQPWWSISAFQNKMTDYCVWSRINTVSSITAIRWKLIFYSVCVLSTGTTSTLASWYSSRLSALTVMRISVKDTFCWMWFRRLPKSRKCKRKKHIQLCYFFFVLHNCRHNFIYSTCSYWQQDEMVWLVNATKLALICLWILQSVEVKLGFLHFSWDLR